jgi:hypothetical protein
MPTQYRLNTDNGNRASVLSGSWYGVERELAVEISKLNLGRRRLTLGF